MPQKPLPNTNDSMDEMLANNYDAGYQASSAPVVYDDELDLEHIPARLPAGTYNFEIESATATRSKADAPQIILECSVLDGDYEGQHVRDYLTFSSDGAKRFAKNKIQSIIGEGVAIPGSTGKIAEVLLGRTFRARTLVDENGGYNTPKLDRIVGNAAPTHDMNI